MLAQFGSHQVLSKITAPAVICTFRWLLLLIKTPWSVIPHRWKLKSCTWLERDEDDMRQLIINSPVVWVCLHYHHFHWQTQAVWWTGEEKMKRAPVCQGNHDAAYTALHHNIRAPWGGLYHALSAAEASNRTIWWWGHIPLNSLTPLWVYSLVLCILSHLKQASFLTISLFHTHTHTHTTSTLHLVCA